MKKLISFFFICIIVLFSGCDEPRPIFYGLEDVEVIVGEAFEPREGVVCKDSTDTYTLPYEVTILLEVDTNTVGSYRITYNCEDDNGKVTTEGRNIYVVENPDLIENNQENVLTDGSYQFQLNEYHFADTLNGYNSASEYQFLSVCFTYKNITNDMQEILVYPTIWANDELYYYSYVEKQPGFRYGRLASGGVESGCVTFEVPITEQYEFNFGETFEARIQESSIGHGLSSTYVSEEVEDVIGDIVNKGDYEIQVLYTETQESNLYVEPREGYEFLILEVIIKNTSETKMDVSAYEFFLLDSFGYASKSIYLWGEDELTSAALSPGGTVQGTVGFEVPKGEVNPILIYDHYLYEESRVDLSHTLKEFDELESSVNLEEVNNVVGSIELTDNIELQVDEIFIQTSLPTYAPNYGNEILIVSVRLKNVGEDTELFSEYSFSLTLPNGQEIAAAYLSAANPLGDGSLMPNQVVTGTIVFEVPVDSDVLILNYEGSWGAKRIQFNLLEKLDTYSLLE